MQKHKVLNFPLDLYTFLQPAVIWPSLSQNIIDSILTHFRAHTKHR